MSTEPSLLASDLDGTLIPPTSFEGDGGVDEFARTARSRPELRLAYVTGRHRSLALDGIRRQRLPRPDVLVCDVGTSVFHLVDGDYGADTEYAALMRTALGGLSLESLHEELRRLPGLRLQEDEKQAEFKLSYYAPGGSEGRELARRATSVLDESLGRGAVVYSVDPVSGAGLLDILPPGAGKDLAVRYLLDRLELAHDRLVFAGDSGNDRAALLSGVNAVLVGNAPPDLRASIRREAAERNLTERLFLARSPYARGVLEGCRHFGIL